MLLVHVWRLAIRTVVLEATVPEVRHLVSATVAATREVTAAQTSARPAQLALVQLLATGHAVQTGVPA